MSEAVLLGVMTLVGSVSGVVGALVVQWFRGRHEQPVVQANAKKLDAEARKTAADIWHELYDDVCERLGALEEKCDGLQALVKDVEKLKADNRRLRQKVNLIIHWYNRLYYQAVNAGLQPEYEPPEPEVDEDC